MTASVVAQTVAAALALEELGHLRALECLPTPEALLDRLQARDCDFNILVGAVTVYLRAREPKHV